MFVLKRSKHNPFLVPNQQNAWESRASFNWCVIKENKKYCAVYRAVGESEVLGLNMDNLSTIGFAESKDGILFDKKRQIIKPKYEWEKYGCEDPRVTKFEDSYYIFYTALSEYPFSAKGIKVALAKTNDWQNFEKRLVTPFNAKAMALFPERINGKIAAVLTVNSDMPPSRIGFAMFDNEEEMFSESRWNQWYQNLELNSIDLRRSPLDHVEVGAPPVLTNLGWLLIYSHIQNYLGEGKKVFGIEAVLLDVNDPRVVKGRTKGPIMVAEETYEKYGLVPDLVFPSGALVVGRKLKIYYGGADTISAMAEVDLNDLLDSIIPTTAANHILRYKDNPILQPNPKNSWESKAVFNPAAIDLGGKIHLLYRAMSQDNTSVIGYASSKNGFKIDKRLDAPIYVPREDFEIKKVPGGNSGCEDPRIVQIDNRLFMTYTAYNGVNPPRVAITDILVSDFLNHNWNWAKPRLITSPDIDDKDACIFPEKINEKYIFIHRVNGVICADTLNSLYGEQARKCVEILRPRPGMWDGLKVGLAFPPIKSKKGWLLFYHGVSERTNYRMGIALLDLKDPFLVKARTNDAVFYPEKSYELYGQVPNVVFPCGAVLRKNTIYIYYGGADSVVGVAIMKLSSILRAMS
jgi:predicted GH43/DUF377 family glycosyl hydrolase